MRQRIFLIFFDKNTLEEAAIINDCEVRMALGSRPGLQNKNGRTQLRPAVLFFFSVDYYRTAATAGRNL